MLAEIQQTENENEKTNIEIMSQRNTIASEINYDKFMFEGLEDDRCWGYGFRRLTVKSTEDTKNICPYTFTSFGYKTQDKKLLLGMRMNVDQHSPVKFIDWDKTKNPTDLLSILMRELMCDFFEKKKNIYTNR